MVEDLKPGLYQEQIQLAATAGLELGAFELQVTSTLTARPRNGPGLSESFEVDGNVVKVSRQPRGILFKNAIRKEMPSRVAG